MEQELLSIQYLSSPMSFSGVRVIESFVLCVLCVIEHCLSYFPFSFVNVLLSFNLLLPNCIIMFNNIYIISSSFFCSMVATLWSVELSVCSMFLALCYVLFIVGVVHIHCIYRWCNG